MKKLKQMIDKAVEWFSIALVIVMVLLVLWQIIARYLLNSPSSFSEALTRYLFVWLVLITSTYAFGSRDHMYISALNDRLRGKTRTVVNILIEILTILFSLRHGLRRKHHHPDADGLAGFQPAHPHGRGLRRHPRLRCHHRVLLHLQHPQGTRKSKGGRLI